MCSSDLGTQGIFHTGIGPFDSDGVGVGYGTMRYSRGGMKFNVFTNILNGDATGLLAIGVTGKPILFKFDTRTFDVEFGNINPLGAIIAKSSVMDWKRGSHASTFGGNPVCCAAALETIAILQEGLIDHAAQTGAYLQAELRRMMARHPMMGDVRGLGLMVGVEIVKDRATRAAAPEARDALIQSCFQRGLLLLGCGASTLRFCPPLVVERHEVDVALRILDETLCEMEASTTAVV